MVKPVVLWQSPARNRYIQAPNPARNRYIQAPNGPMSPMPETRMWYRYDKKFALFPIRCKDGYWTWFNHYYKKYLVFSYIEIKDVCYYQYKLTEADAVVEKLSDNIDFR
jgi:hypothetical protein